MQENPAQTRLSWRLQEGGRLTLGATLTITMTTITLTIITIRTAIVTNKTLTKEHNYKDERSRIV